MVETGLTSGRESPGDARQSAATDFEAAPLVSVVILMYNSARYIGPCLRSLARQDAGPLEIVIVDNASADDSLEAAGIAARDAAAAARLLPLRENRGCAGGNNAGWCASRGNFIVFLNPDTEASRGFIRAITAPMLDDSRTAVTGARIYYPGTRILQHAGGIIYPNAMTNHHGAGEEDTGGYGARRDADYVTGAGFAVRRAALEMLGGFDEDYYPAYYEETDLCTRARRAGWRVIYTPDAVLYHHESVSLIANSPGFRRLYQRMRILYCLKNFSARDWLRGFLPFELWWMRHEPAARGHRREQLRAYREGFAWWLKTLVFPVRRRWNKLEKLKHGCSGNNNHG
ncbi:MAG: glycosyltransferase family 2 protein [Candidatus Sumerlaeota bacterium]|nr:glycosyltransferase family 2 protein [Candidatus Sumerlaeota bacterium]